VADNARRVLGVDAAKVLPVSARAALEAKLESTRKRNGFYGGPPWPCPQRRACMLHDRQLLTANLMSTQHGPVSSVMLCVPK
jgi:hypothetical protein